MKSCHSGALNKRAKSWFWWPEQTYPNLSFPNQAVRLPQGCSVMHNELQDLFRWHNSVLQLLGISKRCRRMFVGPAWQQMGAQDPSGRGPMGTQLHWSHSPSFLNKKTSAHPGERQHLQNEQVRFSPCAKNRLQTRGYFASLLGFALQPQPHHILSRFPPPSSPLLTSERSVMLRLSSRTHWPWCKTSSSLKKEKKKKSKTLNKCDLLHISQL